MADDRLCCEPNSVTTWFVPLGRFSEQIDYDIHLVNTAPLIEEQQVVDIDRLIPLYVYNILLVIRYSVFDNVSS